MRQLILNRIEEIRQQENDFSKNIMRWQWYTVKGMHISEAGFINLTDESLLQEFERLITQIKKQM